MLKLANSYLNDSAQPSNYAWNFGSLLAVFLGIQIVTGVTLAADFNPSVAEAFSTSNLNSDRIAPWNFGSLLAVCFGFPIVTEVSKGLRRNFSKQIDISKELWRNFSKRTGEKEK